MLKGATSKEKITNKILKLFENSFLYNKEIRIPCVEDGQEIQIKITLTTAKENISSNEDKETAAVPSQEASVAPKVANTETSAEEKANLSALLRSLGL